MFVMVQKLMSNHGQNALMAEVLWLDSLLVQQLMSNYGQVDVMAWLGWLKVSDLVCV